MADIINNPAPSSSEGNGLGTGLIVGIVIVILVVVLLFMFGLPWLRSYTPTGNNQPAAPVTEGQDININVPEKVDLNVNQNPN